MLTLSATLLALLARTAPMVSCRHPGHAVSAACGQQHLSDYKALRCVEPQKHKSLAHQGKAKLHDEHQIPAVNREGVVT